MDERQLFDRPIEAYLADENPLKWLRMLDATASETTSRDSDLQSFLNAKVELSLDAIVEVLESWDFNRGPNQDDSMRNEIESKLKSLSEMVMTRSPDDLKQAIRAQQKMDLGYGYIFVDPVHEFALDSQQQAKVAELSRQIQDSAWIATNKAMESIQIRNPQAYACFKLSRFYEEVRQLRAVRGREFYNKSLSAEQRAQVQLGLPE